MHTLRFCSVLLFAFSHHRLQGIQLKHYNFFAKKTLLICTLICILPSELKVYKSKKYKKNIYILDWKDFKKGYCCQIGTSIKSPFITAYRVLLVIHCCFVWVSEWFILRNNLKITNGGNMAACHKTCLSLVFV